MNLIKEIFTLSITILILDYLYLGSVLNDPFMKMITKIQKADGQVNYVYAGLVYILIIVGIHTFIIKEKKTPWDAFLLGIIIYGVFDFTNLSILSGYSLPLAIHDTIWGGTLFYITTRVFDFVNKM